jgi:LEA14-like dessication related protein
MTMKRLLLVLATLGLVTVTACASLQRLAKGAFQKPRLSFKSARLADASLADATVDLVYQIENPNPLGLNLASVDYAFFVEGKQVVAGTPKKGLSIPAKGRSELVFPANVRFADIAPVVTTFLTKDKASYRAQGSVGIQTPLGVLSFPLEHEGTFDVPKVPQVELQPPKVTSLNLSGARIEIPLKLTNRNGFALPVGGVAGALKVGGASVGNISTGDLGLLEAGGTRQVTLPLTINFANALPAANALRAGKGQVALSGQLVSDGQAVPVDVSQLLNFQR